MKFFWFFFPNTTVANIRTAFVSIDFIFNFVWEKEDAELYLPCLIYFKNLIVIMYSKSSDRSTTLMCMFYLYSYMYSCAMNKAFPNIHNPVGLCGVPYHLLISNLIFLSFLEDFQ